MPKFDVDDELVRKLAALLEETGLTELEYSFGEKQIRVARGAAGQAVTAAAAPAPAPSTAGGDDGQAGDEPAPGTVTAPMVGTVYLSPEPGAPPFVTPGDSVTEGQTLLLIEAMKTFNPVRATRSGTVVRILVGDGAPVEYGEGLVMVE